MPDQCSVCKHCSIRLRRQGRRYMAKYCRYGVKHHPINQSIGDKVSSMYIDLKNGGMRPWRRDLKGYDTCNAI